MAFDPAAPDSTPYYQAPAAAAPKASGFNPMAPDSAPMYSAPAPPALQGARTALQDTPADSFVGNRGDIGMGGTMVHGVRNILDLAAKLEHGATGHAGPLPIDEWIAKQKQGPLQVNEEADQAIHEDPAARKGHEQGELLPYLTGGGGANMVARKAIPKAFAAAAPRLANVAENMGGGALLANAADPTNAGLSTTAKGAVAGGILPAAANTIGAVAKPFTQAVSPAWQKAVDVLRQQGIPVDAAQATGSNVMNLLRRYLSDSPGGHGTMDEARKEAQQAYTGAQLRNTGETGHVVDADNMLSRIGLGLDHVAAHGNVKVDMPLHTALANLETNANQISATPGPALANMRTLIDSAASNNGVIPGTILQQVRTNLTGLAKQGDPLASQLNDTLMEHFDIQMANTPLAQQWATLRNQYKNTKILQKATTPGMEGDVSPAKVSSQLNNTYNIGRNTPQSTDPFVQTARAYQQVTDKFPNSGTAHRSYLQHLGTALPAIAGGILGGTQDQNHAEGAIEGTLGGAGLALLAQRGGAGLMTSPEFSRYFSGAPESAIGKALQGTAQVPAYLTGFAPGVSQAAGAELVNKYAQGGKVEKTMHEFKHGELHSGSKSGKLVTSRKQAVAIALSQQRRENAQR